MMMVRSSTRVSCLNFAKRTGHTLIGASSILELNSSTITTAGRLSEEQALRTLRKTLTLSDAERGQVLGDASQLVQECREHAHERAFLDQFLAEYGLSSSAGVALMCISEALLRIPDERTADALLSERLSSADWAEHLGHSDSVFLNASTWALLLTGKVMSLQPTITQNVGDWLASLVASAGETAIRAAMAHAVRILANEFVFGRTIDSALQRAERLGVPCSFDMLGEGARTSAAADEYFDAYVVALRAIAKANENAATASGMSVKLSALHPRYEPLQRRLVLDELSARMGELTSLAADLNVQVSIDAEEANRLELSLEIFERLARSHSHRDWDGLGFVVQAYSKRGFAVVEWLEDLARLTKRTIPVRLVKGAYWDAEIKAAQVDGLAGYPVFTRKASTDLSWLAAMRRLFTCEHLYPQVATHNAYSIAAAMRLSAGRSFEFQRLHGMGELLYARAEAHFETMPPIRMYAPVGEFKDLLSYLVRRLLENGANASFVNRFLDDELPIEAVVQDPIEVVERRKYQSHPQIALPTEIYGKVRQNSVGIDLGDRQMVEDLLAEVDAAPVALRPPIASTRREVNQAINRATQAYAAWSGVSPKDRRKLLERYAALLELQSAQLIRLLRDEAGKTLVDAIAEIREAVDFCRYYGSECERVFAPTTLLGPTGEVNVLSYGGRGVIACIAPWNFPLAIFIGQVVAALSAGNTVIAKPAEQTPMVGSCAIELLRQAGLPPDTLQIVIGDGRVGEQLVAHEQVAGVAFTGSFATAKAIQRTLADRVGPIVPLVAETGGVNAMLVDSSVLLEQTVDDIISSAFRSAGQRCSALRLLCVQEDIVEPLLEMLIDATRLLVVGNPRDIATDVGPIIDTDALGRLHEYIASVSDDILYQHELDSALQVTHCGPVIVKVDSIQAVREEVFGPILHIYSYPTTQWRETLDAIRNSGFGLTFGVQTRIQRRAEIATEAIGAGNSYINRDMIGATVGVQPFGGHGLSGTGPKAGGPNYLIRFAEELVITDNVVATGGDKDLLRLDD